MMQQSEDPGNQLPSVQNELVKNYFSESNILHLLPSAVCVCDTDGFIIKYNELAVKIWGTRPNLSDRSERFCGGYRLYAPNGTRLMPEEYPAAQSLRNGINLTNEEFIIERPDKSCVNISMNTTLLLDEAGKQVGVISCFYDISGNKEVEKQLKIKSSELEDYVNNANVGLHWVDANGIIKWANKAELDMLGYTAEEYIGHHITEFHVNRNKIDDILKRLSCNEILTQYESELRCKNGSVKTVHINTSVYRDEGKFIHTRCFTIDVSAQTKLFQALKESEAALRESENNYRQLASSLEQKVEEKTLDLLRKSNELKKYMSRLEFQNVELEQFVYAASHDLKEPLRKISYYNSYIAETTLNILDSKCTAYLKRSVEAAGRMRTLIEDLLLYSRSTYSTDSYENVDLNRIIEEISTMQADEINFKGGKIAAEKLPLIKGVSFQWKQLLFNLITNSIKYKHPNRDVEIKITGDLVNGKEVPWQYAEMEKQYYKISITDNGIGFEQKYAGKIFEIFQRLSNERDGNSSGIGLAICKKIVQNHKGYITATGTPDVGACFTVYFPID